LTPSILAWRRSTLAGVPQVKVSTKQISADLTRPPSVVGGRIRAARTRAGMTQQQVAAASGLHQSVVSRIEQGVANPTARTLAALSRALDARLTLTGRQA